MRSGSHHATCVCLPHTPVGNRMELEAPTVSAPKREPFSAILCLTCVSPSVFPVLGIQSTPRQGCKLRHKAFISVVIEAPMNLCFEACITMELQQQGFYETAPALSIDPGHVFDVRVLVPFFGFSRRRVILLLRGVQHLVVSKLQATAHVGSVLDVQPMQLVVGGEL